MYVKGLQICICKFLLLPLCKENEDRVTVSIKTDGRGADIYWFLKQFRVSTKKYFNVAKSGRAKYGNNTLYTEEYCVKKNKW